MAAARFEGKVPCGKLHCEWVFSQAKAQAKELDATKARLRASADQLEAASKLEEAVERQVTECQLEVRHLKDEAQRATALAAKETANAQRLEKQLSVVTAADAAARSTITEQQREIERLREASSSAAVSETADKIAREHKQKVAQLQAEVSTALEQAERAARSRRALLSMMQRLNTLATSTLAAMDVPVTEVGGDVGGDGSGGGGDDDDGDGSGNGDGSGSLAAAGSVNLQRRMELIDAKVRELVSQVDRERDRGARQRAGEEDVRRSLEEAERRATATAQEAMDLRHALRDAEMRLANAEGQLGEASAMVAAGLTKQHVAAKEQQLAQATAMAAEREAEARAATERATHLDEELRRATRALSEQKIALDLAESRCKSVQGMFDAVMAAREQERNSELQAVQARDAVAVEEKKRLEVALKAKTHALAQLTAQIAAAPVPPPALGGGPPLPGAAPAGLVPPPHMSGGGDGMHGGGASGAAAMPAGNAVGGGGHHGGGGDGGRSDAIASSLQHGIPLDAAAAQAAVGNSGYHGGGRHGHAVAAGPGPSLWPSQGEGGTTGSGVDARDGGGRGGGGDRSDGRDAAGETGGFAFADDRFKPPSRPDSRVLRAQVANLSRAVLQEIEGLTSGGSGGGGGGDGGGGATESDAFPMPRGGHAHLQAQFGHGDMQYGQAMGSEYGHGHSDARPALRELSPLKGGRYDEPLTTDAVRELRGGAKADHFGGATSMTPGYKEQHAKVRTRAAKGSVSTTRAKAKSARTQRPRKHAQDAARGRSATAQHSTGRKRGKASKDGSPGNALPLLSPLKQQTAGGPGHRGGAAHGW